MHREVLRRKQRHAEDQQNLNITSLLVGTNCLTITATFKSFNKLIHFQKNPSYASILANKNKSHQAVPEKTSHPKPQEITHWKVYENSDI